jgi:hypothetical protein
LTTDSRPPNIIVHSASIEPVESGSVPTFDFTGELHDPATGMVNLRARWYNPSSSSFPEIL